MHGTMKILRIGAPELRSLGPSAIWKLGHTRVPKGHPANSPTLQRWVERRRGPSPEGTAEKNADISPINRPFGTWFRGRREPNAKALGYCHPSLRDNALAGHLETA